MSLTACLVLLTVQAAPVDGGVSMTPLLTEAEVLVHSGQTIAVVGTLRRVRLGAAEKGPLGTGVLLDDGAIVYVTHGAPPAGWAPFIGQYVRVEGLLADTLTERDRTLTAPHLRNPSKPQPATRDLAALLGRRLALVGTARDAKGGAVLLLDGTPIYLEGVAEWPSTLHAQTVRATGVLRHEKYLPTARRDEEGAISQGADGDSWVLERAVVELDR